METNLLFPQTNIFKINKTLRLVYKLRPLEPLDREATHFNKILVCENRDASANKKMLLRMPWHGF